MRTSSVRPVLVLLLGLIVAACDRAGSEIAGTSGLTALTTTERRLATTTIGTSITINVITTTTQHEEGQMRVNLRVGDTVLGATLIGL